MKVDKKATAVVQLKNISVWSINAKALPPSSESVTKHDVDFEHFISQDDSNLHQILMEVKYSKVSDGEPSFELSISASAFFEFASGTAAETISTMALTNCIPMTYSAIRGIVFNATASLVFGQVILPSVNFIELAKKKAKQQQRKQQKKRK